MKRHWYFDFQTERNIKVKIYFISDQFSWSALDGLKNLHSYTAATFLFCHVPPKVEDLLRTGKSKQVHICKTWNHQTEKHTCLKSRKKEEVKTHPCMTHTPPTYTVRTQGSIPPTVPWVPKSCCLFHTVPLHVQGSPLSLHNILGPQCLRSKRLYVLTQLTPSLSPHKSPSSSCFPLSLCSTDLWDQTNRNGLYLESAVYNISAWRCRNRESSSPHSPHSTRLFQLSRVKLPIFLYAEITTNAPNERKMHTHEWLLCQQKCSAMIFKIKKKNKNSAILL